MQKFALCSALLVLLAVSLPAAEEPTRKGALTTSISKASKPSVDESRRSTPPVIGALMYIDHLPTAPLVDQGTMEGQKARAVTDQRMVDATERIANWTVVLVFVSFLSVVGLAVQTFFLRKALLESKKAARIAQKTIEVGNRAWLEVRAELVGNLKLSAVNHGRLMEDGSYDQKASYRSVTGSIRISVRCRGNSPAVKIIPFARIWMSGVLEFKKTSGYLTPWEEFLNEQRVVPGFATEYAKQDLMPDGALEVQWHLGQNFVAEGVTDFRGAQGVAVGFGVSYSLPFNDPRDRRISAVWAHHIVGQRGYELVRPDELDTRLIKLEDARYSFT